MKKLLLLTLLLPMIAIAIDFGLKETTNYEPLKQSLIKWSSLKDPFSAQFRNVYTAQTEIGGIIYCGQINTKNSWGAYGGFQTFYLVLSADLQGDISLQGDNNAAVWGFELDTFCEGTPYSSK